MLEVRIPLRGSAINAVWAAVLIFAAALLLRVLGLPGWIWLVALAGAGFLAFWLPYTASATRIAVGRRELRIKKGRSFTSVRRLPRRFISGCMLVATPLQRVLGVCILLVHTAGGFALLIGISREDGEKLLELLDGEVPV